MNLDYTLKTLGGKDAINQGKPLTVAETLSSILLVSRTGNKLKLWALAQTVYKGGIAKFDVSDKELLKKCVEDYEPGEGGWNVMVTGQLIEILSKPEEVVDTTNKKE